MALKPRQVALPPRVKPRLPIEVDWRHPLLRGVKIYHPILAAGGDRSLVLTDKGLQFARFRVGSTADLVISELGPALLPNGLTSASNRDGLYVYDNQVWLGGLTELTCIVLIQQGVPTPSRIAFVNASDDADSSTSRAIQFSRVPSTNKIRAISAPFWSTGYDVTWNPINTTEPLTVAFTWRSGQLRRIYAGLYGSELNLVGQHGPFSGTTAYNTNSYCTIGGNLTDGSVIYFAAVYARQLSLAELRALHADPYAPIRKRRVLMSVTAGGVTSVLDSVSAVWDVKNSLQNAINAIWTILNSVSDSSALNWNVLASVNDAITINWLLSQRVANAVQFNWILRQVASDSISQVWHILNSVNDQAALSWNVKQQILDTLNVPWGIRQSVADSLAALWNVLSSTSVIDGVSLQWLIKSHIAKTQTELWNVLQRIETGRNLRWLDLQLVQDAASLNWKLLQRLADSVNVQWHVLSNTQVIDSLTFQWNIGGLVDNALTAEWRVLEQLGVQENLYWTIRQRVADQISAIWNSLESVGDSVSLTWHSAGRVGENLVMVWNIQTKGQVIGKVIIVPMRDTDLVVLN